MNLLIVDDVPEIREWMAQILVRAIPGARIALADGAATFFQAIERSRPDAVILDEVLGIGDDSREVLRKALSLTQRVILVSGVISPRLVGAELPAGVLGRLKKPDWDSGQGEAEFAFALKSLLQA